MMNRSSNGLMGRRDESRRTSSSSRKDEDLALFQDMRIREHDATADHLLGRRGLLPARSRVSNDLLTSETDNKNDYDWLLTPPGTPLFPSLDRDWLVASPTQQLRDASSRWPSKPSRLATESQLLGSSTSSGGSSSGGSSLRVSTSSTTTRGNPSPNRRQSAPLPSSSVTKPKPVTSSTSVSRPSTPTRRPSSAPSPSPSVPASNRRPSTPTRTTASRPSTPTRTSPAPSLSSSRPSTPTRRTPTITPLTSSMTSLMSNGRASRGTSPVRRPQQVSAPHERSSSTSRASTVSKTTPTGELPSHLTRSYNHLDRDISSFSRRAVTSTNDGLPRSSNDSLRKPVSKSSAGSRETSFYGTSISKKSLDTAIRHMDIRRSTPSGFRGSPGVVSYPKSSPAARSPVQQVSPQQQQQLYDRLLLPEQTREHNDRLSLADQQTRQQEDVMGKSLFDRPSLLDSSDSFLLELNSLGSTETRFLEEAGYLKDPLDILK